MSVRFIQTVSESFAYRVGDGAKRWGRTTGPYPTMDSAYLAFHKNERTHMKSIFSVDFLFSYTQDGQFDGVCSVDVLNVLGDEGHGFYATLSISGKTIWVDAVCHYVLSDALTSAYRYLNILYPNVQPLNGQVDET